MKRHIKAAVVVVVSVVAVSVSGGPAVWAAQPPTIDTIPVVTPADPSPAPPFPMQQRTSCATSALLKDSALERPPPANVSFEVDKLHEYATGKGVNVAVIDSGVSPNVRLPRLVGGGDFISDSQGLEDCDHHGTLVAGIIGAQPSEDDGFVGVAPDASLISIRQTSSAYEPVKRDDKSTGSATLATVARAIIRSANMNASVINLSVTACFPDSQLVDTSDLAKALRYAVDVKDVVVIASAGNTNDDTCKANPGYDPANSSDPRNWAGAHTISMPSFYTPLVISVGGSDLTGNAYSGTMTGPWVSVAAPAVDIVSLDPTKRATGGLTNASVGQDGPQPIAGTSFAAAYVTGLAALIREKYPELNATEVRDRIVATAHTPAETQRNTFGDGVVDPVAALTWQSADAVSQGPPLSHAAARDDGGEAKNWLPVIIAVVGVGIAALVALMVLLGKGLSAENPAGSRRKESDR